MDRSSAYTPVQDGITKVTHDVQYTAANPPTDIDHLVQCFWELRTIKPLSKSFNLHAIPDACTNIMFDEIKTSVAGVTALRTTYEVLPLGREFHYIGIQFLPGVWRGDRQHVVEQYIDTPYSGELPLVAVNKRMVGLSFLEKQSVLTTFVRQLMAEGIVGRNEMLANILGQLDSIRSVADMAVRVGLTPRQLQRTIKQDTGFSPHDLLKVLRLQQAFKQGYPGLYSDQAHFIHSFRKITGYTPAKYFQTFDV